MSCGLQVALSGTAFSKDGQLMAYKLSSGGSDWAYIKVLTVDQETGETTDLEDKLEYVKFSSLAWTHDHKVGTMCSIVLLLIAAPAPLPLPPCPCSLITAVNLSKVTAMISVTISCKGLSLVQIAADDAPV
jgi:hypothetical protein